MKKSTVLLAIFVLTVVLSGCGCRHEWEEATCDKPKTCKLCGETEGDPLGHAWEEATCESPRTCTRCGKTEGEANGHKWEEATCTEPKKCSVCGNSEGEALGHDFAPATLDKPKTCRNCGETEGEPIAFDPVDMSFLEDSMYSFVMSDSICVALRENPRYYYTFTFYDLDGNKLNEQTLDARTESTLGWSYSFVEDGYLLVKGDRSKADITVYDYDFEPVFEKILNGNDFFDNADKMVQLDTTSFDGINRVYRIDGMQTYFGVDVNNKCECSSEEYYDAASKHGVDPDYDNSKWSCHEYDEMINGYFVGTADGKSWGYVDLDENEIKMFKDATSFTQSGYALVSADGKTYDIIDTEMNIIAKDVLEAIGVSHFKNSKVFRVYLEDGSTAFYAIN